MRPGVLVPELPTLVRCYPLHPRLRTPQTHTPYHSTVQLLKVSLEGAELAVLQGVKPKDWRRVKQAAVEVDQGLLPKVMGVLRGAAGYTNVVARPAGVPARPNLYLVWATRAAGASA